MLDRSGQTEVHIALADLAADLIAALKAAGRSGSVTAREFEVTYLYYWMSLTFAEIADTLDISVDAARRAHKRMLEALRDTGLLEGYESDC